MGDNPHAQAARQAPFLAPADRYWVYFVDGPEPVPLGIYDEPSSTVGVQSVEIPAGSLSRVLRDATSFVKRLEDALPGSVWKFIIHQTIGGP